MNRIFVKAKAIDTGVWVEGYPIWNNQGMFISKDKDPQYDPQYDKKNGSMTFDNVIQVDPESVRWDTCHADSVPPCEPGDTVWVVRDCHSVIKDHNWKNFTVECPFADDCKYAKYTSCYEFEDKLKIFKTSLKGYCVTTQWSALLFDKLTPNEGEFEIGKDVFLSESEAIEKLSELNRRGKGESHK